MVEVTIAAAVLSIALAGLLGVIVSANAMRSVNRETALAHDAARGQTELMQEVPFNQIFAGFNADGLDDPPLPPPPEPPPPRGPNFFTRGLAPQLADADGLTGQVIFPTVIVAGIEQLREDVVDPKLGMPRDLNGDGAIDALDHSGDYNILPVRIRLQWTGMTGNRILDIETMLTNR